MHHALERTVLGKCMRVDGKVQPAFLHRSEMDVAGRVPTGDYLVGTYLVSTYLKYVSTLGRRTFHFTSVLYGLSLAVGGVVTGCEKGGD